MAAFAWSLAVPASLYITRSVGSTVSQGLLRNPAPQPLDSTVDTEGALASADAALRLVPVSPTASHLRSLVESGAARLRELVQSCKDRQQRRSFSRLFRNPCFREENSRLRSESETLKSRVHLFLTVVSMFPEHVEERMCSFRKLPVDVEFADQPEQSESPTRASSKPSELSVSDIVDGEEVETIESSRDKINGGVDPRLDNEMGRISLVKAFARRLTESQDSLASSGADGEDSSGEYTSPDEDDATSDSTLAAALRHWVS